jgi:hypothetical protein
MGLRGDGGSVRRMVTCPASWGDDGRSRAGCADPAGGIPGTGGRARTGGCVRPGWPTAGHRWSGLPGPMLARSVRGHRLQGSGVQLQKAAPGQPPVIRAAGLSMPRRCRARRWQECYIAAGRKLRLMLLAGAQRAPVFLIVVDRPARVGDA